MISDTQSFYRRVSVLSLLIFILAAWFSIGYHHPDEHFQILEFTSYKLGNTPVYDLPWEYNAQIRPALPVFVAFCFFKLAGLFGITDPFVLTFFLRLITALAAWRILQKISIHVSDTFLTEGGKKILFALVFLLWFMPYASVRFSTENLSAVTFLFAVYYLLKHKTYNQKKQFVVLIFSGILLGFSFYFRFQMGFAILGLGLWFLVIEKTGWKFLVFVLTGGIISIGLNILIDFWFYGNWVLSPVNYFTTNIIEDVASNWGVSPWWDYFYLFFLQGFPPISIALLMFFFAGIFRAYKSVFFWCLLPFLIAHFLVGHKEMRFMFPMVFSFIYLCAVGIDYFIASKKFLKFRRVLLYVLIFVNLPLLFYRSFSPARELISYHEFLYNFARDKKIELICFEEEIYRNAALNIHFYRSPNVNCIVMQEVPEFLDYLKKENPPEVYFVERDSRIDYDGYHEETLFSVLPDWVSRFNFNDWTSRAKIWKIKKLERN